MNVLWISSVYPPKLCGIGNYVNRLTNNLANQLNIILFVPEGSLRSENKTYFFRRFFNPFYLIYIVLKEKIEVVQTQFPEKLYSNLLFLFSLFCIKLFLPRVKLIVTIHEIEPYFALKLRKFFIILEIVKFMNDAFIFTNRKDLKLSKVKKKFTRIIPLFDAFQSVKIKGIDNFSLPEKYGLYMGNIHQLKNLYPIIKVFSKFKSRDYYLIVAYGDIHSDIEIKIKDLVEKEGIKNKIIFFKGLDDSRIKYLIENAQFMILCYKNGITPRSSVLMSALEYNKPYLAEIGSYTPRWLKRISSFYYYVEDNEKMIFQALQKLFAGKSYKIKYYNFLKRYFSIESVSCKYVDFYKMVIKKDV